MSRREILKSIHGRQFGIANDGHLVLNKTDGSSIQLGLSKDTIITSAQLLALNATPQTVIPAPDTGYIAVPRYMMLYKPAGTAYVVDAGDDLVLKYTNGSGAQCSSVVETTGFLDQTTAESRIVGMPGSTGTTAASYEPVAAAAVVLHLLGTEVTTGTGGLVCRVFYDILPSTLPTS